MNYNENLEDFQKNGCTIIKGVLTLEDVEDTLMACDNILNKMDPSEHCTIFKTGEDQVAGDYFLKSSDKISFFFEEGALDSSGNLKVDKNKALNKIGHALHWLNPQFKKITFDEKIKNILSQLGYKDPVVVQSMYIFKHPEIGGKVVPHQDSTFVHTKPLSTIGFWFPLVDVTEENGCLFYIPGSHKGEVYQRFVRKMEGDTSVVLNGEFPPYDDNEYKPVNAKKGDCVLIHGSVIHKSGKNYSNDSRPIYTFHVVEKENTVYSSQNWLQPSPNLPFPSIYAVVDSS